MAPFTKGKRKDEEEIYVNAQQISKGEFWQIPLPFTDFLVSIILLGSSLLPASPLIQYFSLPCLQFSGLLQVLGNAISIPVPYPNIFYCHSSSLLLFVSFFWSPASGTLLLTLHFRVQLLTLHFWSPAFLVSHFQSHASGLLLLVFYFWSPPFDFLVLVS